MNSKDLYFRLLRQVRPYTRIFALSLLGTIVAAATEPLIPALIKPLLDGSFVAKDPQAIRLMPLLLVGVFILRGVAGFIGSVAMEWIAHRVVMDLRNALFARLLTLPTGYFDDHSAGSLMSRLTYDVTQVMTATTQALVTRPVTCVASSACVAPAPPQETRSRTAYPAPGQQGPRAWPRILGA